MEWLKRFMTGRNGIDQLSIALLVVSMLFSVLSLILQSHILDSIYIAAIIFFFFRVLSKNIAKRYQENKKFLEYWNPIKNKVNSKKNRLKNSRYYRYYNCTDCNQTLRIPKGKGKVVITCPKCSTKISKKS